MATTRRPPEEELADAAGKLPPALLFQATGGSNIDLRQFFWSQSNILDFGDRLVSIAGLAASAIYVASLIRARGKFPPDPHFHDHIRSMLFDRGYDVGLACAALQRAGALRIPPFDRVVGDDRVVTAFISSRRARASNQVRSEIERPVEDRLLSLLNHLDFLGTFSFVAGSQECRFGGQAIDLFPFLFWDGTILRQLVRLRPSDRVVVYRNFQDREENTTEEELIAARLERVKRVARAVGTPRAIFESPTPTSDTSRSIMPLFAASYPAMCSLAHELFKRSERITRSDLWLRPYFGTMDRKATDRYLDNAVMVTNAIIRKCLAQDPVTVLEEFFEYEHGDVEPYIESLVSDPQRVRELLDDIEAKVQEHGNKLEAFFSPEDDRRKHLRQYRSRLVARRIVELMGFRIIDNEVEDDIADYIDRAQLFFEHLREWEERVPIDQAWVKNGLLHCCKSAERILRFLIVFYQALQWFRRNIHDGLDDQGRADLTETLAELSFPTAKAKPGLGTLIGLFKDLNEKCSKERRLREILGHDAIWPAETDRAPMEALKRLNEWRINYAHVASGAHLTAAEAAALVSGYLEFLRWLSLPDRGVPAWRIYPAELTLNLVTMNSCGITSLRYVLREAGRGNKAKEVTLYTTQPLSVESGCFYGLPHVEKTLSDLWIDPVLLPVDAFAEFERAPS